LLPLNVVGGTFPVSWLDNHLFGNGNAMGLAMALTILCVDILVEVWYDKYSFKVMCAIFVLAAATTGLFVFSEEEEALPVPVAKNPEVVYVTTPVSRGDLEDFVSFNVRFVAVETVDVMFENDGRLERVHKDVGDKVEIGDVLMELENQDALFELEVADKEMEAAKIEHDYVTSRNRETSNAYKIAELEYQLKQLEYDKLKAQVEASYLYSPINGIVIFKASDLEAGTFIEKLTRMFTIADTSSLIAESSYNDTSRLKVGQEVDMVMNSTGLQVTGTIAHLPGQAIEGTDDKYTKILIDLKDEDQERISDYYGQSLTGTIWFDKYEDVLYIPENLVLNNAGTDYVRVLKDGVVVETPVKLGAHVKGNVIIESGLEEGDEIIYQS